MLYYFVPVSGFMNAPSVAAVTVKAIPSQGQPGTWNLVDVQTNLVASAYVDGTISWKPAGSDGQYEQFGIGGNFAGIRPQTPGSPPTPNGPFVYVCIPCIPS